MSRFRHAAKIAVFGARCVLGTPRRQRRAARGRLVVFTYHAFCRRATGGLLDGIPEARFERQLRFLRDHFEVVSLADGLRRINEGDASPRPLAAVTIDDGFASNHAIAWPLLRRYALPATIFVATDFLDSGRPPWPTRFTEAVERSGRSRVAWPLAARIDSAASRAQTVAALMRRWRGVLPAERDAEIARFADELAVPGASLQRALGWDEVREMHAAGIEIGSHTVYHSILPDMPAAVVARELADAKRRIESELQSPCRFLAYPNGDHDTATEAAARDAGYAAALSQDFGSNDARSPAFALRRVEVPPDIPLAYFSVRASRALAAGGSSREAR